MRCATCPALGSHDHSNKRRCTGHKRGICVLVTTLDHTANMSNSHAITAYMPSGCTSHVSCRQTTYGSTWVATFQTALLNTHNCAHMQVHLNTHDACPSSIAWHLHTYCRQLVLPQGRLPSPRHHCNTCNRLAIARVAYAPDLCCSSAGQARNNQSSTQATHAWH